MEHPARGARDPDTTRRHYVVLGVASVVMLVLMYLIMFSMI